MRKPTIIRARTLIAALAIGLLALVGCATTPETNTPPSATGQAEATYPITVDNCGTEVTFDEAPDHVVAIKSTSIEMMLALGLQDRVAGVAFPDGPYAQEWAPETEPDVISERVPGQETVLDIEPDLVYAGWESNVTAEGAGERDTLHRLGVNTLVSPAACQEAEYQPNPLTWEDLWDEITLAGDVFDVSTAADSLITDQQQRLDAITSDDRGLSALWYSSGSDTPYVGAGIGNPQLVMDAVGLTNIAGEVPMTWSSLSWEAVVDADPDVIVLVDSDWGSAETKIAQLEGHPATAALPAVQNHRYLIIPFPAGEAGVRSVEAVETIHQQLADLDLLE
ncbi:putative F420-0 ABC transporter substrate-binding protein [Nesterenkonia haasae]|uniref:putative F420-0 ABC transporter substrate-binding protein n=1 Tax=Nesterenkonia haasae TaxID=2587813 RepID=UPI001391B07F|nr:putative F420-0 ABC transporter substrate-binding protein [Nesterenkonia haasae]NDK30843.1 putative F420-0 ABC transporter substrate-binding protein [Nesterenkonia haasae]